MRVFALLVLLVVVSGCVSRAGSDEVPAPTAADGGDLSACADGTCEVFLDDAMEIGTPAGALVVSFADGVLEYEIVSPDGGTNSGSIEGLCVAEINLDGTGGSSVCYVEGELPPLDPGPGQLALQVVGADSASPVLRMAVS